MADILFSFFTAFALTYLVIPPIIKIAVEKELYDVPGERCSHNEVTPSLGGIAIFAGVVFSIVLWTPYASFETLQYTLCAFIIIFLIGAKDDIIPLSPAKKLVGQLLAAFILVFKSNLLIPSLYGIFGVYDLPVAISIPFSIFTILVIINAFNLIDGINGLSASIGALIALTFGTFFFATDHVVLAIMGFALAGALLAFLRYNITPAKIFMGDTGSLLVGLICSILTIEFLRLHHDPVFLATYPEWTFQAVPAVAIGILIFPLFDTLRVFIMRSLRGRSPLSPDRSHIHHLLIDYGFSHMKATCILLFVNLCFILLVIYFDSLGSLALLFLTFGIALLLTGWLYYTVIRRGKAPEQPAI